MRLLLLFLVATIAAQLAYVPRGEADPYRWCANAGGADSFVNCYFVTLRQCQQAISGNSGYCTENLWYTGEAAPPTTPRKPHRTAR